MAARGRLRSVVDHVISSKWEECQNLATFSFQPFIGTSASSRSTCNGSAILHSESVYCEICEMWLSGPIQWEDHKIGKKHKKNMKRQQQESVSSLNNKFEKDINDKGILIPKGTAILIEQNAIYEDAVKTYLLTLYKRVSGRARL